MAPAGARDADPHSNGCASALIGSLGSCEHCPEWPPADATTRHPRGAITLPDSLPRLTVVVFGRIDRYVDAWLLLDAAKGVGAAMDAAT